MRKLKSRKAEYGYSLTHRSPGLNQENIPEIIRGMKAQGLLALILERFMPDQYNIEIVSTGVHGSGCNLYTNNREMGRQIDAMLTALE